MFIQEEMKKEDKSLFGTNTTELTKDGRLFILISQRMNNLRVSTKNSASISIDHST
jgi:hypothetical protein